MAKYPGQPEVTLEADHRLLVAILTDIRNLLREEGQISADDRRVFQDEPADPLMPTLLELLDGYIDERT